MTDASQNYSGSRRSSLLLSAREARAVPSRVFWARLIAIALILAGALDAYTTEIALDTGYAYEINPVIRTLQDATGAWWILFKMAAHCALAGALMWYPNRPTLIAMAMVTLLTGAVAVNNYLIYLDIVSGSA